jgi:hypothetical protein
MNSQRARSFLVISEARGESQTWLEINHEQPNTWILSRRFFAEVCLNAGG